MKTKEEIQANMAQATGTQQYHKFSILFPRLVLTDGVQQLCEDAQCFWLMDIIGSHQHKPAVKNESFQVWTLTVKDRAAKVLATDGNDKVIAKQNVPYTDFPLDEVKLFVADGEGYKVIMLPSEN